ncbi:MAG: ribonuclease P protein component [Pirellulaceae bacterium]
MNEKYDFPPSMRLRSSDEFRRVYNFKQSVADDVLIVYGRPNQLARPRIGLSVSKKIGNAVQRNRWKRHIREAFRLTRHQFPYAIDVVVLPRRDAQLDGTRIRQSLVALVHRLQRKLLRGGPPNSHSQRKRP